MPIYWLFLWDLVLTLLVTQSRQNMTFYIFSLPILTTYWSQLFMDTTQVRFTCSKTIIETLAKKVWNMFKVNNKNTRTTSLTSFWRFYYLLWTYFTPFTSVSINDFEQVMLAGYLHVFCIRKPFFFCLSLNFLNIKLEIRLSFS